jgi:hypothetical protein
MTIEQFGDQVRIEQRAAPVRPIPLSRGSRGTVLTTAGNPVTANVIHTDSEGNPIWAWVVYQRQVVVNNIHPWTGEPTIDDFVWMPVQECNTYDEAAAAAKQLAGTLGSTPSKKSKGAKH